MMAAARVLYRFLHHHASCSAGIRPLSADAIGETADQGTVRSPVSDGIRQRDGADALKSQTHLCKKLPAEARLLGFLPAGRRFEIVPGFWGEPQHHAQSDCSMAASTASASRPVPSSVRKLSNR